MKPSTLLLASALGVAATCSVASAQPTVVYRETFSTTTNNLSPSTAGWGVNFGNSGAGYLATSFSQNAAGISNFTGRVADVGNLDAGSNPSGTQTSTGFFFIAPTVSPLSTSTPILAWTAEGSTLGLTTSTAGQFSFYMGNTFYNTNVAPVTRLAVQVGTSWFVTSQTFTTANISGATFGTTAELKTFNFTTTSTAWHTLTFTQNGIAANGSGSLSLGATATSNLSGNINAWGIYVDSGTGANVRFDTFTVSAIPEPSAFAALAGLGMLGFAATRRRRA
jgi:hypothetical protein